MAISITPDFPPVPGSVTINGLNAREDLSTHLPYVVNTTPGTSFDIPMITANVQDHPTFPGQVRLVVHLSTNPQFSTYSVHRSAYGPPGVHATPLPPLALNTKYYVRVYCRQKNIPNLSAYSGTSFWSERYPLEPTIIVPADNVTIIEGDGLYLQWAHKDADDPADIQASVQIQWRTAATLNLPPGAIQTATIGGNFQSTTIAASNFSANTHYEWRMRTSDAHSGVLGAWTTFRSFFVLGSSLPPLPISPINDVAVPVDQPITFSWRFRDPAGETQSRADIRYRVVGTSDWATINGDVDPGLPGPSDSWTIDNSGIQPGYNYEWQVRTYDSGGLGTPSDWSTSVRFWSILTPGYANEDYQWIGPTEIQGALGNGSYRVFVFDRGGQRLRGEVTPLQTLRWGRVRDDISSAFIRTSGFSEDCCALLGELRTWAHELVVFRDGERVWEGPVTRIAYHHDSVEIEARDPMVYVYRRIMRQGYNDNVRTITRPNGTKMTFDGRRTVVDRAALIIANALAPDDPNVLPWLTRFDFEDDTMQARSVQDWSKTAWEEVDNLAATAGLDYTTVGRRIILHDTHRAIGRLAEMREKDFFERPIITEYGMSAANIFGVTNNSGVWGSSEIPRDRWGGLGAIEQLASEYGESDGAGGLETLTPAQISQKVTTLNGQAQRNLDGRWPAPLVARVPDNSRINPEANVGINQLVPGVHIPLRVETLCRSFAQVQKLDSLSVEVIAGDEQVKVVMSPAPGENEDPDANLAAEQVE